MTTPRYTLRDLPGVADLEARFERIFQHKNPMWAPENDGIDDAIDALSHRLFGIAEDETHFDPDDERFAAFMGDMDEDAAWEAWEKNFAFLDARGLELDEANVVAIFRHLGWDCCDEHGELLLTAKLMGRQIVCASLGLIGRLPGAPMSDEEAREAAEAWGDKLLSGKWGAGRGV